MRRPLAAALGLAALALASAWVVSPDPASGDSGEAPSETSPGPPVALEVRASLAVEAREVACPGAGDCVEVRWRPNVQASALVPGTYEARAVLDGTGVSNSCSFLSPAAQACEDTATDARTPGYHAEVVPESEEGGEVCRTVEATLSNAGVWVAQDRHERCVDAETTP